MNPFTICILLLLLPYPLLCNCFDFGSFDPQELISVSCEFSTLVSREKRDLTSEEPNLDDPAALLSFLYPLANVPVSHNANQPGETSRSILQQPSYLEDFAQTWRTIWCNKKRTRRHRKQRRSSPSGNVRRIVKRDDYSSSASGIGDLVTWAGYLGNASSNYLSPPQTEEITESSEEDKTSEEDSESVEDKEEEGYEKEEKSEEDEEEEDNRSDEEDEETAPTTTAAPAPPPPPPPPPEDPYFASYGGDVECFIPLMSFTIPFDGQITLLGFHGFKGMFPY